MNFNLSLLHSKLMKSICVMTAALLMWTQNLGIEISLRGCYDSLRSLVSYSFYEPTVKVNRSGLIYKKRITQYRASCFGKIINQTSIIKRPT